MTLTTLVLESEKLPIFVSLPRNDIELAKAAIRGGASGIKVHLNAFHRASGSRFGSFDEELPFLKELAKLDVAKAIMVGQDEVPTAEQMRELSSMGFEAFNLYLDHLQPHLLGQGLRPVLALGHGFTEADLDRITATSDAWIEASIVDPKDYGKALSDDDIQEYSRIVQLSNRPVIVPSQKKITPEDLPRLRATGIKSLLLGVIVTGATAESIEAAIRRFVSAQERPYDSRGVAVESEAEAASLA